MALTVGDVIEVVAGIVASVAAWCYAGWALSLGVAAVFLLYMAQNTAGAELKFPRRAIQWRKPRLVNPNTCLHNWEVFPGEDIDDPSFVACTVCGIDRQTGEKVL